MLRSSLNAGTTAMRRTAASGPPASAGAGASETSACSVDMRCDSEIEQLEQAARPVAVGVLVEHPLARAAAHLLGLGRIVEQRPIGGDRLAGVVHDEQLAPRLEPALDPLVRVRDDRGAGRGELERAARRGARTRSRASGG